MSALVVGPFIGQQFLCEVKASINASSKICTESVVNNVGALVHSDCKHDTPLAQLFETTFNIYANFIKTFSDSIRERLIF